MTDYTQWDIHTGRYLHCYLSNNHDEAVDLGTITLHGIEVTEDKLHLVERVASHFAKCGKIQYVDFYDKPRSNQLIIQISYFTLRSAMKAHALHGTQLYTLATNGTSHAHTLEVSTRIVSARGWCRGTELQRNNQKVKEGLRVIPAKLFNQWDELLDEDIELAPLRFNSPIVWFPDQDPGPNHPLQAYLPRTISVPPSPRYQSSPSYHQVKKSHPSLPKSSAGPTAASSSKRALASTASSPFKDPSTPITPLFPNDPGPDYVLDWSEEVPEFYSTPYKSALQTPTATTPAAPFTSTPHATSSTATPHATSSTATPHATSSTATPHAASFYAQGRQWKNGTFFLDRAGYDELCSYLDTMFFTPNTEWSDPVSYDTLLGNEYDEATIQHLLNSNAKAYNWLANPLEGPPTGVAKLLAMMPVDILKLPAIATDLPNFNIYEDQVLKSGQAALERRSAELLFNHKSKNLDSKKLYWGLGFDPFESDVTLEMVKEGWATEDQLQVPSDEPATSAQLDQLPPPPTSPPQGFSYNYDDDDDDDDEEDEDEDVGYDAEDLLKQ